MCYSSEKLQILHEEEIQYLYLYPEITDITLWDSLYSVLYESSLIALHFITLCPVSWGICAGNMTFLEKNVKYNRLNEHKLQVKLWRSTPASADVWNLSSCQQAKKVANDENLKFLYPCLPSLLSTNYINGTTHWIATGDATTGEPRWPDLHG